MQEMGAAMKRIWMPLPDHDFDVSESAVPWKVLTRAGHEVVFATERGDRPAADQRLLDGVVFGKLGAEPEPKAFYHEMAGTTGFRAPRTWAEFAPADFDAIVLPGGHAPRMKQLLDSALVQAHVAAMFASGKVVGAICHGVLVAARARDATTGESPLSGRRTTCLPKYMERAAYLATFWKLGRYYRTYDAYVEDEVRAALAAPGDFLRGPRTLSKRGTDADDRHAFVVEDGAYVSGRWPGDVYLFGKKLLERL